MDPSVAEKKMMDKNKLLPVSALSVSVVQKKLIVTESAVPPLTIFHLVNLWTLLNAFSITFAFACYIISTCYASRQPMSTTDDVVDDDVLLTAMLWCSTPQAVAGTLALLLPSHCRRLRRASAYVGLAATVAVNCIWVSAVCTIIVDDPDNLLWRIVGNAGTFMYMGFDLLAFLALVRGAGQELLQSYLINLADVFTKLTA